MSTDPTSAALTRDDAAVAAGAPPITSEQSSELTGIATAIERVEALLAAGGPEPEGSDAIERIADIAFVLHERDVEASLCDALDAAVRELANANAAKQTNVHQVRQAAEMLRELSQRVADVAALLQMSPSAAANDMAANEAVPKKDESAALEQLASEDALDGEIPREGLFAAELLEDDEFARAVAELAASLPALADPVETIVVTLREAADFASEERAAAPKPDEAISETQSDANLLATDEPSVASELEEAVALTQHEPARLAADALASEPNETRLDVQRQPAELAAEEAALAPEQEAPAMTDAAEAIEQTPPQESPIAEVVGERSTPDDGASALDAPSEESEDYAILNQMPASEGALSEVLSGETLLSSVDALAQQPTALPGASPDHSLVNGHAIASLAHADAPHIASEAPASPAPKALSDSETTRATDNPPITAADAEPELPPSSEAPPPADADAAIISAGEPSDQSIPHRNGEDAPAQIAIESGSRDAEVIAKSAAEVKEEAPPRFAESSQTLLPELALVDPQDDPGDLFEPLSGAAPSIAAAHLAEFQSASEISAHAVERQARSAPAAADPLAAMRTLSAEELLALFT